MTAKSFRPGRGYAEEHWDAVSDNPTWTKEDFARAKPLADALPELASAIRKRGPARSKEAISIRLDIDIVQKLRESGPGWQSRVNDALRKFVDGEAA